MQIEIITSVEQLEPLQREWNQAVEGSAFDSVFVSFEWFYAWLKHFASRDTMQIVIARSDGQIIGILPLLKEQKSVQAFDLKVLRSASNLQTYKYGFVLLSKERPDTLKRIIDHLSREIAWDVLRLSYVPVDAEIMTMLGNHAGNGSYKMYAETQMESPYVAMTGTWEDYLQQRNKKVRRNLDYFEKRLEKEGRVDVLTIEGGEDLERQVLAALEIEKSSWKGDQGTSIADSQQEKNFYIDLAGEMSRHGRFALYFLCLNGEKIAFDYCLKYKDRFNVLKTGYNPAYAKNSPGRVLRKKVLKKLYEEQRYRVYDLLGAQDEWKTEWTDRSAAVRQVLIFNNKPVPRFLYLSKTILTALREAIRKKPAVLRFLKNLRGLVTRMKLPWL